MPARLHVHEEEVLLVLDLRRADVLGAAGVGVVASRGEHAAHLVLRVDLVGDLGGPGAGHELVVRGAVLGLAGILPGLEDDAGTHKGTVQDHVHLVERDPPAHEAAVAVEEHRHEPLVELNKGAVSPGAVLLDEVDGAVEVRDGHEGLDPVLAAAAEHVLVEGEPGLVGLLLVAVGKDAAPGDGEAKDLEAHLREEGYVLAVAVVEVDARLGRVVVPGLEVEHAPQAATHVVALRPVWDDVDIGKAAAALVITSLALVGGGGSSPKEPFWKWHGASFSLASPPLRGTL